MIYIIGLGLNVKSISREGLISARKCKKVYLENYTVEFPYSPEELEEIIKKNIILADREFVESFRIIDEAKKKDVALLVYGSPLAATTHISLVQEAKISKIRCKVIHNASVIEAIAETGLQIYKFGKITSMPEFETESFIEIVKDNLKINAHSLILVDIGVQYKDALKRLENILDKHKVKTDKIVACSKLGTKKKKICYDDIKNLKERNIEAPFCFVIPGKLHFLEKEVLESF